MVALAGLDFHDQRGFPGKERQHFLQIGDLFLRPLQPAGIQLLRGHIADVPLHAGGALQTFVVHDHQTAVPAQMYVQLHAVTRSGCQTEGGNGIFRHGLIPGMKSPVGEVHPQKGGLLPPAGMARRQQKHRHSGSCRRGAEKLGMIFQIWHLSLLH